MQDKSNDFIKRVLNIKSDKDSSPFFTTEKQRCGKLDTLCILLKRARLNKTKVLLFSNSTHLLDIIQNAIINEGYTYGRIDGSMSSKSRLDIVNQFNSNKDPFIMLISTKAGGYIFIFILYYINSVGLNLTGGNIVIIFDPNWNPAWDIQAQDRSYRIGQNKDVTVYRLISTGTIEEITYYRQVYKQQLAAVATEGHTNQKRIFNAVSGVPSEYGKLFGVKNLFSYNPNGFMEQFQKDVGIEKSSNNKLKDDELDMEESLIDFSILNNSENMSKPFSDKSSQDLLDCIFIINLYYIVLDEDESSDNIRVMEHNALFQDSDSDNDNVEEKDDEEKGIKRKRKGNLKAVKGKIEIIDDDESDGDETEDEVKIDLNPERKKIKTHFTSSPIFIPPHDSQSTKSSSSLSSIEIDLFVDNKRKNEVDDSYSTEKSAIIPTIKDKIEGKAIIKPSNNNNNSENETEDEEESPSVIPQEKKINDNIEEEEDDDDEMYNLPTQLVSQTQHQFIPQQISSSSSSSLSNTFSNSNKSDKKSSSECGVDYLDSNLQTQNLLSQMNNSLNYSLVNKQKLTPGDGVSISSTENSYQQKTQSSVVTEDVSDILDFL